MKNFRNIFALLVLTIALYSCDSTVTIDDPKTETIEATETIEGIYAKTSEEGNEGDDRPGG